MQAKKTVSIKEVAVPTGLTPSTLRSYEEAGVSLPIAGDPSSGHRVYAQDDVEVLDSIACLVATGMSIAELRKYVVYGKQSTNSVAAQVNQLPTHNGALRNKMRKIRLRRRYLGIKIRYWQAVEAKGDAGVAALAEEAFDVAQQMC